MLTINKTTGEINTIQPGGLYAPLPIPAYQVLARMGDHKAKDVLVCLVSHLGSNGTSAYPSYTTIAAEAGMSRNSIRKALDVLDEYGFIKTVYTGTSSYDFFRNYYSGFLERLTRHGGCPLFRYCRCLVQEVETQLKTS